MSPNLIGIYSIAQLRNSSARASHLYVCHPAIYLYFVLYKELPQIKRHFVAEQQEAYTKYMASWFNLPNTAHLSCQTAFEKLKLLSRKPIFLPKADGIFSLV
jgi:hypothetical protein